MEKVRNTNVELLRFVLMAFILLWHVIVHGYNFKEIGNPGFIYSGNIPITLLLSTMVVPATYCFVFISGFWGIHLKLKKFSELIIWCLIVSIGQAFIQKYCLMESLNAKDMLKSLFPITSNRWWFMTAYIQLMIFSPFLNAGMEKMNYGKKKILLTVIFCFSLFHMFIGEPNAGSSLIGIIFMYLLGRYFKEHGVWRVSKSIALYISSFLVLYIFLLLGYYVLEYSVFSKAQKAVFYFMGFANPLIIVMAVCLFFMTLQLPIWKNKTLNNVLSPNLFVYLITEGTMGGQIYKFIANTFNVSKIEGSILFISILAICLCLGYVIQKITKMFFKLINLDEK